MIFQQLFSTIGFSNAYLVGPRGGGDALLVDPGEFDAAMLNAIEANRLRLRWILVTHAHRAHIAGLRGLLRVYDPEIYCNQPSVLEEPARHVQDGDRLALGEIAVEVIELPGHSIDSLCFVVGGMLFSGDTLSAGGIGRTRDIGAQALMLSGIRKRLLGLGDDLLLFPGHGPPSLVGLERRFNPYLAGEAPRPPAAAT
jgi:glyoxylase-like metal-dependent hydrolase (beta-lactamase superfamily II)